MKNSNYYYRYLSMKNKIKLILIFLISFLFLFSCEKEVKNLGLIIQEHDFGDCFHSRPRGDFEKDFVIEYDSSYQAIELSIYNAKSQCLDNPQRVPVDFSKYSLLGKYVCCDLVKSREVIDDKDNLQYIYKIKKKKSIYHSKGYTNMNWVLVPKLPEGYTVKFVVK